MTVTTTTNRIFTRGETAVLKASFYEDAGMTIPVVPIDSALYPAYAVYDINNLVVQSGVAQPEATAGSYKVQWLVPTDTPLSNDKARYRIEWTVISQNERQYNFVEQFDVEDVVITASKTREQKYITLVNYDSRVSLRLESEVLDVKLNVYLGGDIQSPIVTDATTGGGGISIVTDGDSVVYYYDIAGNLFQQNSVVQYGCVWAYRYNVTEPYTFVYQSLTTVTPLVLEEITSVRMLIDKFQKRLGTVQAYEDSDILEYLARGNELVNAVYPTTYYAFGNLPPAFNVFHVLYAAWYGLSAQNLLEGDLAFNFSGQSVTLDMDRTGTISDVLSRWQDFISTNLPPLKMSVVRRTQAVGTVAGRPIRYTSLNNFTFKISSYRSTGGGGILGNLVRLGLLF